MKRTAGIWITGAAAAMLAFAGCSTTRTMFSSGNAGQTWTLSGSPKVPSAEGKVRVAAGGDGNQTVDVEVEHLAQASKVFAGTTTYVVWVMPQGGAPPQNLGVLQVGEDLKGHLTTKTPFKSFDIVVTAEVDANVAQPSGNRVLSATVTVAS
jgi:hypothetical protein